MVGVSDDDDVVPWAHLLDDEGHELFPITDPMKLFWTELYDNFPNE